MDDLDLSNFGAQDLNEPIPLDGPIPFENIGPGESGVSHAPLDLGGGTAPARSPAPAPKAAAPKPAAKPAASILSTESTEQLASGDRIVGMKTFYTKLHAGAITFLEEQIARWLKGNPSVVVKRTNVVTGPITGKKVEPNIIITVWY